MELIHYGCKRLDPRKFMPIKNRKYGNKPSGGLWTSPVKAAEGWRWFCKLEMPNRITNMFVKFRINKHARILKIDSLQNLVDTIDLYRIQGNGIFGDYIDYENLAKDYDAVWLTAKGQWRTRLTSPSLYGWDVETVFIMNPKIIKKPW